MRCRSLAGTRPANTSASVPRLTPLKSDRTTTSSPAGSASGSARNSPRPGSAIQNARASAAATGDTITFHPAQMISTEWHLPVAPLRASAVTATVAGVAGAFVLAEASRSLLPVGDLYAVKAAAIFAIVMLFALGFLARDHPYPRFGPANQVTTLRAVLVALVAALIGEPRFPAVATSAAAAGAVISVLDGVDGWLARRFRVASAFGARFDMEIDALLILMLSILVSEFGKAGPWVMLSGLLRYIFIGAGRYWPRLREPLFASRRRQAVCVVQILALVVAILPAVQPPLSTAVSAAALAALAFSFLVDTRWLLERGLIGSWKPV